MSTPPIQQPNQVSNTVASSKQDPTALRNHALKILRKPVEVDVKALVQKVTDKPDLFDSFDSDAFHSKFK